MRRRPKLQTGVKMLSETISGDVREGDIGTELGEIAKQHPNVTIGSYPFFDEKTRAEHQPGDPLARRRASRGGARRRGGDADAACAAHEGEPPEPSSPVRLTMSNRHRRHLMATIKRNASAKWSGSGKEGKGAITTQSGVLSDTPYSFSRRFGEEKGTNPGGVDRGRACGLLHHGAGVPAERRRASRPSSSTPRPTCRSSRSRAAGRSRRSR